MERYNHKKIEPKWQQKWEDTNAFATSEDPQKPKYYILDMFPYPSGAGLHVGHVLGYTATDIIARYKRQKGFNVLHPMGWDAFGLPAEQYAIRTGTHPAETTKVNVDNYRRQLKAVGLSYDWGRELSSTDPKYYKWTQWIFTKLFEKGLAYEAEMLVNYCPHLGTVVANEEIEDGRTKEGGYPIERRPLKQWVLKITEYADRLLKDLDQVDWPESIKHSQVNWIGRQEGCEVTFEVADNSHSLTCFTTRPDTLFGVSYLVVAPEHPLIEKLTTPDHREAVATYQQETAKKTDLDRAELSKDKSGIFTGSYAINPVTEEKIPIWVADYVLMGYGTGAVMAVPAHDERDHEFATKFKLPIVKVIEPKCDVEEGCWTGEGTAINSHHASLSIDGLPTKEAKARITQWLEENNKGKPTVNYRLRDWLFSRQRYWGEPFPVLHLEDGTIRTLDVNELPLVPPEVDNYKPTDEGLSPLAGAKEWVELTDPKTGKQARRETNTMPQWAGSCWYYLRFCDPFNENEFCSMQKQKEWMPVDLYVGGAEHAVLHLLYARFWHKVLYDCGVVTTLEPFQRLRNQGMITARSFRIPGGHYIAPEHVVEREGKYYHKETLEELESHIEKMSKSKLNVVNPDEMIEEYGADALRLYEMFMGPLDKEKVWNTDGVHGCYRFLKRLFDMAQSEKLTDEENESGLKLAHRLVHFVEHSVEQMTFNTAVAKMMEFANDFSKLEAYPRSALRMAIIAMAPYIPHIAEEVWEMLGGGESVFSESYPEIDTKYLSDDTITYIVQVNGKLRGRFDLPKDQDEETIVGLAKENPKVTKFLEGTIRKVIFVPNKLLNFVVTQ